MSTCCVVRFVEAGKPLYAFYKHYDGDTFGQKLREFFAEFTITEGLPAFPQPDEKMANGLDDLAAQTIAYFKDGPGDIYLCHPSDEGDFTYAVSVKDGKAVLTNLDSED